VNIGFALHSRPELQAAFRRATARAPNHAPKSRPWQTGQEEILLPVGKIGKGRAVPALCYGTARKPGKKLKMRYGWSGALLLGLAKTELSLQFDANSRVLANLDSIVHQSCDAVS